jgi:4a-hydroxytetrahydrobiopterin dehydratase
MNEKLSDKKCQPCEGIGQALTPEQALALWKNTPQWRISNDKKKITREFVTKNFTAAVDFINLITKVAEEDNHHPDLHLTDYRKLQIELSTHALGGLSENDFILAAKIDTLPVELKKA